MILASKIRADSKDGELVLVHRNRKQCTSAKSIASSFLSALENWAAVEGQLKKKNELLLSGNLPASELQNYEPSDFESALPRTFLFADGSAFIHHIKLVRKARNAPLPETLETVPLMYQAESARFLRPTEGIPQADFSHGTDFEAEVGVVTDFVPMGISPAKALEKIRFVVLINDVSLRGLIPAELAMGFGFFQSKPAKALSPFALSLDEFASEWQSGRLQLPICVDLNGKIFGRPNAREMHFHFGDLIAHAAKTRDLQPGTLIGSGTVSNENEQLGSGCLAELRTLETLRDGKPKTDFLRVGDQVDIWMQNESGEDLFGMISQKVIPAKK